MYGKASEMLVAIEEHSFLVLLPFVVYCSYGHQLLKTNIWAFVNAKCSVIELTDSTI